MNQNDLISNLKEQNNTYYSTESGVLIQGDCLENLKLIPDKSINLICLDPPYNIKKAKWDTWKTIAEYVEFMGKVFKECERVLMDNGSFYFFHNDFEQMAELQHWIKNNTTFKFKQMIVWDKFNGSKWNQLNAIVYSDDNRNYSKQAEYCLYYTFQDDVGSKIDKELAPRNPFRLELIKARKEVGLSIAQVAEKGHFYGKINHGGAVTNWEKGYNVPLEEQWELMKTYLPITKEYSELRREYEENRYTFNNQNLPSVWLHEPIKQNGHITPKPIPILHNIIKTSSNENDIVLDCFSGSGTLALACEELHRNWICIEKEEKYCEITKERFNLK